MLDLGVSAARGTRAARGALLLIQEVHQGPEHGLSVQGRVAFGFRSSCLHLHQLLVHLPHTVFDDGFEAGTGSDGAPGGISDTGCQLHRVPGRCLSDNSYLLLASLWNSSAISSQGFLSGISYLKRDIECVCVYNVKILTIPLKLDRSCN